MHSDLPVGTIFSAANGRGGRWVNRIVPGAAPVYACDTCHVNRVQVVAGKCQGCGEKPRLRYDGGPLAYTGIGKPLEPGTVIHRTVWETRPGEQFAQEWLVSRGTYTLKAGDAEWASTGIPAISTLSADPEVVKDGYVYANRFGGKAPAWLRSVR